MQNQELKMEKDGGENKESEGGCGYGMDHFFYIWNNIIMKKEYWEVSDEQVLDKTGKKIGAWIKVLEKFKAAEKKSNDVVVFLQHEHEVPRYWARTLTTLYLKMAGKQEL
jgi:hypothetical protein